ncbi:hypothetical protein [Erwinia mallotivora]|uniref:hypothetical protein n=1 Tax=Erwinia mallotivora TaxID=69222 RepID=UPI0021C1BD44|nr:hypothetical protein [Erwinia mallotivora]
MLYMFLCSFLIIVNLLLVLRMGMVNDAGRFSYGLETVTVSLLTGALASPFFVALYLDGHVFSLAQLARLSAGAQYVGIAAAIGLTVIYARLALREARRFWFTGSVIASALLTFIFADSLQFVSRHNAGVVPAIVLHDSGVSDVKCMRAFMLVHYSRGIPADWRCPESIVLMADSPNPFVPWPDYHYGRSQHLTTLLDTLFDGANHEERNLKP